MKTYLDESSNVYEILHSKIVRLSYKFAKEQVKLEIVYMM